MSDFLLETIKANQAIYNKAFEEGRKIGHQEGYMKANKEILEILDKKKDSNGKN